MPPRTGWKHAAERQKSWMLWSSTERIIIWTWRHLQRKCEDNNRNRCGSEGCRGNNNDDKIVATDNSDDGNNSSVIKKSRNKIVKWTRLILPELCSLPLLQKWLAGNIQPRAVTPAMSLDTRRKDASVPNAEIEMMVWNVTRNSLVMFIFVCWSHV